MSKVIKIQTYNTQDENVLDIACRFYIHGDLYAAVKYCNIWSSCCLKVFSNDGNALYSIDDCYV